MTGLPDRATPFVALGDLNDFGGPDQARRERDGRPALRSTRDKPFAKVVVFDTLAASAVPWLQLQAVAPASPYQTFAWISAWMDTEGAASGTQVLICMAADASGRPVAILPLGLRRIGFVTVASFLGGRHANYNLGLFAPALTWSGQDAADLFQAIVDASPRRIDAFVLANQPHGWGAWINPLASLPRQASPSRAHSVLLPADGEAFLRQHLSPAARKKMRSKSGQLAALGPVSHLVGRSEDEIAAIIDAHIEQKAAKFTALGLAGGGDLAATRRLLRRAAAPGFPQGPSLELHALVCGTRIVATFGGLPHAGRFAGLVISHDAEPAYARLSPGELLLAEVIRSKCRDGFTSFDLGIGEDRYKQSLCPTDDLLFDSLMAMGIRGRLFVASETLRLHVKGRIKRSVWAWTLVKQMRRRLAGLRRPR